MPLRPTLAALFVLALVTALRGWRFDGIVAPTVISHPFAFEPATCATTKGSRAFASIDGRQYRMVKSKTTRENGTPRCA